MGYKIIDYIDKENLDMVEKVNITDFMKCISAVSRISMHDMYDNEKCIKQMAQYLNTWAKNKRHIYEKVMGGSSLVYDSHTEMDKSWVEFNQEIQGLITPEYYALQPYITFITEHLPIDGNGVLKEGCESYNEYYTDITKHYTSDYFCSEFYNEISNKKHLKITTLASKYFNLPKKLVDGIGRALDANKSCCNITISIDPVDMLTCSTTPYHWQSCYRIKELCCGEHSDGPIAAMLDTCTSIIYGWHTEGRLSLGETLELKNNRYKLFRSWLVTSNNFDALFVTSAYPYREENHTKYIRRKIEDMLAEKLGYTNLWKKAYLHPDRKYLYGYDEFCCQMGVIHQSLFKRYEEEGEDGLLDIRKQMECYNELIYCPCGCGSVFVGSDQRGGEDDYEEAFETYVSEYGTVDYDNYVKEDGSVDEDKYYADLDEERANLYDNFDYEAYTGYSCEPYDKDATNYFYSGILNCDWADVYETIEK